jgi:ABC-type branched-subunit amino acid transport system ATPase component
MSRLRVAKLSRKFGGVVALNEVTMAVEPGERRAIIGPNGAGKSTLFNLVTGNLRPTLGQIYLDGRDITYLSVHQRARLGLGRTFQRNNLFSNLTVFENVYLAVQQRQGLAGSLFKVATHSNGAGREATRLLERVGLLSQQDVPASTLAYGQQRALEVALALAVEPAVLLLDEPTAGMSPAETADIIELIGTLPPALTILIVEHDMDVVFSLADRITVLHYGRVVSEGTPAEVRADPQVQEIYLGTRDANPR